MRGSDINSVKHAFTVVVYGVVAMLEGRNVLAVLGKLRFVAITHDKRYCLQLDSCQENCWKEESYLTKKLRSRRRPSVNSLRCEK